jgi:hypothetical protein
VIIVQHVGTEIAASIADLPADPSDIVGRQLALNKIPVCL